MLYTHGSKGAVVRQIQKKVGAQVTGVWDTLTYRKVYEYQKAHGLHQTGEVNDETHKHMFPPAAKPKAKPKTVASKPAPKKMPPKPQKPKEDIDGDK
jgi:peptidoglycan hydrolase-like protein with peptidoglycan-binding domain